MGFLFPKAPKPVPGANPAQNASTANPYSDPMRAGGSFIGGSSAGMTAKTKNPMGAKTSLIGGG